MSSISLSIEDLINLSGCCNSKDGKANISQAFRKNGVTNADQLAQGIRVTAKGYACSAANIGHQRLVRLVEALRKIGFNVPEYDPAKDTPGIPYGEGAVIRRIMESRRVLAKWEAYAKKRGYKIPQPSDQSDV